MSKNLTFSVKNLIYPIDSLISPDNKVRFDAIVHESRTIIALRGAQLSVLVWLLSFIFDLFIYPDNLQQIYIIRTIYFFAFLLLIYFFYPFDMLSPYLIILLNVISVAITVSLVISVTNDPSSPYILAFLAMMFHISIIMNLRILEALLLFFVVNGVYNFFAIFVIDAPFDNRWSYSLIIHSSIVVLYAYLASRIFTILGYNNLLTQIDNELKTESINKQHIELKAMDNAKSELLSNISHEFRTPLTLILSPIELLESNLSDQQLTKNYLSVSKREGLRLLRLVNNLLDSISSLNKGNLQHLNIVNVLNPVNCLLELSQSFALLATAKNITLDFKDLTNGKLNILFDSISFDKVTSNLLMNAVKYTSKGNIAIFVESKNGNLVIKIIDTGVGISDDDIDSIFERFKTGKNTHNSGTGIGLSLVKTLVESHNGTITLVPNLPTGTIATITIPIFEGTTPQKQKTEHDFFESLNKQADRNVIEDTPIPNSTGEFALTVLIVDDEVNMRSFIFSIFEKVFNVYTASSASDALSKLKTTHFDLAILDYMLPDMNGLELNIKIKANYSHIKTIMLTANQDNIVKEKALDGGLDDFYVKPFHRNELLHAASKLLDAPGIIDKSQSLTTINDPIYVLIIEDNQDIINLISDKFGEQCLVHHARTLKEASVYLDNTILDIITVDIGLSDGNGIEFILDYKSNSTRIEKTRLIGISGSISNDVKFDALKVCHDFIEKPFNLIELELRLKNHIDNVQLNRKLIAQNHRFKDNQDLMVQREKVAVLGELSMSYMHEIKNPLNYSMAAIQCLTKEVIADLSLDEVSDIVNDIEVGLNQINTITSNIKNYSYKELTKNREPVSIESVIEQSISFAKSNLNNIDVQVICPNIFVLASLNEITQIFINLLNNSASALKTQDGDKNILINASTKDNIVEIFFSDNGPGINESETHKLYDKFYSTKSKTEGTGLGLSISRTIVEGHNGTMDYVGNGPGAIFKITLPSSSQITGHSAKINPKPD
jgi:signal transduction histidine kinase